MVAIRRSFCTRRACARNATQFEAAACNQSLKLSRCPNAEFTFSRALRLTPGFRGIKAHQADGAPPRSDGFAVDNGDIDGPNRFDHADLVRGGNGPRIAAGQHTVGNRQQSQNARDSHPNGERETGASLPIPGEPISHIGKRIRSFGASNVLFRGDFDVHQFHGFENAELLSGPALAIDLRTLYF
jgi:hypothetical protein